MRIQHVKIRNFRAVKEFDGKFGNITSFIGYNGSGKSSIIRAINWFFEGHDLKEDDFFINSSGERSSEISVEIKFTDIDERAKSEFKKYINTKVNVEYNYGKKIEIEESFLVFRRVQEIKNDISKLYETPYVIPEIYAIKDKNSRDKSDGLKNILNNNILYINDDDAKLILNGKLKVGDMNDIITRIGADSKNSHKYKSLDWEDANNAKGFAGTSALKKLTGFVFLPAGDDISCEFDSTTRGSALNTLVGSLLKSTLTDSIKIWQEKNQKVLDELDKQITKGTEDEILRKQNLVNSRLKKFLPGVNFKLDPRLEDWEPKPSAFIASTIENNGYPFPIEKHGHGVQRATLLALLQAVADNRFTDFDDNSNNDYTRSSLVICIEEPEVYQHPQQSRAIARSFHEAANAREANIQFIYATHSQYFVDYDNLNSTYRVVGSREGAYFYQASSYVKPNISHDDRLNMSKSEFKKKSKGYKLSADLDDILKYSRKDIIEGLFAKACLIVEGDTDQFIFENIPVDSNGRTLESYGVSVINANGCSNLWKVASIFHTFGIPTYILRDGDSNSERAEYNSETLESWKSNVDDFIRIGRKADNISPVTKEPMCTDFTPLAWKQDRKDGCFGKYIGLLQDDLENELEKWNSFMLEASNIGINDLRSCKEAGKYLRTLNGAKFSDIPASLLEISNKVINMCQ